MPFSANQLNVTSALCLTGTFTNNGVNVVMDQSLSTTSNVTFQGVTVSSYLTGTNAYITSLTGSTISASNATINSLSGSIAQFTDVKASNINSISGDVLNIGTVSGTTVNIGKAGDTVNIAGTLVYVNSSITEITNPQFHINVNNSTIDNSGLVVMQTGPSSLLTGAYLLVNSTSNGWVAKAGTAAPVNINQDIGTGASPTFGTVTALNVLASSSITTSQLTSTGVDAVHITAGIMSGTTTVVSAFIQGTTGYFESDLRLNTNEIHLGAGAGSVSQQAQSIAIGNNAGQTSQSDHSLAIGGYAGQTSQGDHSIAIGDGAAQTSQKMKAVALGINAGHDIQGTGAVAIGHTAGFTTQGQNAIAIGFESGQTNQALNNVAIGTQAGQTNQQFQAVAIGYKAGNDTQHSNTVAVGYEAGQTNQGTGCIAIGTYAGQTNQGNYCIAIGYNAATTNQWPNSIVLNASDTNFNAATTGFYVNPVRNLSIADLTGTNANNFITFNSATNELAFVNSVESTPYLYAYSSTGTLPVNTGTWTPPFQPAFSGVPFANSTFGNQNFWEHAEGCDMFTGTFYSTGVLDIDYNFEVHGNDSNNSRVHCVGTYVEVDGIPVKGTFRSVSTTNDTSEQILANRSLVLLSPGKHGIRLMAAQNNPGGNPITFQGSTEVTPPDGTSSWASINLTLVA